MNARLGLALVGLLVLGGLACDKKAEPEAPDEKTAAQPEEALARPPTRDLATLQSELAKQEAELRRLGVLGEADGEAAKAEAEPGDAGAAGRGGAETTATKATDEDKGRGKDASNKAEKKKSPTKTSGGSKDAKAAGVPGSAPRPSIDAGDATAPTTRVDEEIGGAPQPDPAKSVQAPPRDRSDEQEQLRAEDRCPLICSLAENTCELAEEICSLAEQHGDDDEYSVACERASNDCKQAQEACLECHG